MFTTLPDFEVFPKMARLSRECIITEKIDGTNAQIYITPDLQMFTGSRNRWITPEADNYGFAAWANNNKEELLKLGPGRHYGEWWGSGIQRGYGRVNGDRSFSLFNASRWTPDTLPACCLAVPVLYRGLFTTEAVSNALLQLQTLGSEAARGFMKPEGIIVYHVAAGIGFKKTLEHDGLAKSQVTV